MKFSIIVPVYNVEGYLNECIESILTQSFCDYEVILIDDGSVDDSGKLCDFYARRYTQFRVIHQENKGLSVARNVGIELARGEYILFVDSDDCLENTLVLEQLASASEGCDIVVFAWKEVPDGRRVDDYEVCGNLNCLKEEYSDGKIYLNEALKNLHTYPWYPWRYVFNKKFWDVHSFRYMPGIKYEDVDLVYQVILAAGRVKVLADCVGYHYRTGRKGSIVTEVNIKTYCSAINVIASNIKKVEMLTECTRELKERLMNNFSCLYYTVLIQSSRVKEKEEQRKLWKYLKRYIWICNYTTELRQSIVKKMIVIIGIPNMSRILGARRKVQNIRR